MNYHKRYTQNLGINVTKHIIFDLMRSFALFIALGLTTLLAKEANGQTKMTIQLQEVPLKIVLEEIQKNSEYIFFYLDGTLPESQRVSVSEENATLESILNSLLPKLGLGYKKQDRQVILFKAPQSDSEKAVIQEVSQDFTVSGTVTDGAGMPLPGASIVEKGTTNGVQTDFDGKYSLTVPDRNATLLVSYIGYSTKEININGQSVINITLQESAAALDEIVVIGYGSVKKSDLTGAVSSIKNEDFNQGVVVNVDQAITGRIPGVQVLQTSGEPGGGTAIRIRGASSINAGNEPLFVIDGLPIDNRTNLATGGGGATGDRSEQPNPRNPLNNINPNDIESIEVLKDASATAIYGSRGANGVILITTKSGASGVPEINFDHYTSFQDIQNRYDILDAQEYINVLNTIANERGQDPVFTDEEIAEIGNGTDWQDEIFRTAITNNYNLSISGGSDKAAYFISSNYLNQEGTVKSSAFERFSLRANLKSQLSKKLDMNLNLNTSLTEDLADVKGGATQDKFVGLISSAALYDPTARIRDENGEFTQSDDLFFPNPTTIYEGIENRLQTTRVFGNATFNYKISNGLNAKLNLGGDKQNVRRDIYNSKITLIGELNNGLGRITQLERSNYLIEYTMTYDKKFNDNHVLNILGGVTYQDFITSVFTAGVSDFTTDITGTDNLGFGNPEQAFVDSNKDRNSLLSYLARVNYTLFDEVLLTASIRADGSSRFGENNKFGYFPAFVAAWKLHQREFVPAVFNQLKLRASWGVTGNESIGNYNSIPTFVGTPGAVLGGSTVNTAQPARIANPNLRWEQTEQLNLGLDFGLLKERISGSIDYFDKTTKDLLIFNPLPRSSGFNGILENVGSLNNKGIEVFINSRNIVSNNFSWTTAFNFATLENEVLDIGTLDRILQGGVPNVGEPSTIVTPGTPLNAYFGYKVLGIFQNDEEVANSAQPNSQPGFPRYQDTNSDGMIDEEDRTILGDPYPDFTFGFSNTFRYKNLSLDIQINGQFGADLLNATEMTFYQGTPGRNNKSRQQIEDRWTLENPTAKWPSGVNPNAYGGGVVNSLFVEDASYIRIQNISLRYNLPVDNIDLFNRVSVYGTIQNLATFTDYSGVNPDANVYGRDNSRIDRFSYPLATSYILGINVTF